MAKNETKNENEAQANEAVGAVGADSEKKLEKVGAMWSRTSKSGNDYFGIDFNGEAYMALKNNFKESEKQPDFIIYKK